jgi:hypothetical protein
MDTAHLSKLLVRQRRIVWIRACRSLDLFVGHGVNLGPIDALRGLCCRVELLFRRYGALSGWAVVWTLLLRTAIFLAWAPFLSTR